MEYTQKLAEFCAGISFDNLPADVIEKAKLCILDFLTNVFGSLELDAAKSVKSYIEAQGGPTTATALGCGFRTGAHLAAFLNGTLAEAIEAQDGLRFGGNHPGVAVIPAALAMAESQGRGGKELIAAVAVGYEVASRIAAAMHPHHTMAGFLPTGTCGAFGAAAAVSKLMGHDRQGLLNSLGIAGFVLPLSMAEHLMGGYTSKILQGGQAASAGLTAAGLAGAGITGPPFVLEGSALGGGFTRITCKSDPSLDRIVEGLGERFALLDIYLKPYTACRHTHGSAQASLELLDQHKFEPQEIEAVDVFTYGIAAFAVGKAFPEGGTFISAQFSIPYVVAACLVDQEMGPRQLTEERLTDPVIRSLSQKVNVKIDAELAGLYPEFTASRVEIRLRDGRTVSKQIDLPKGDPRDPMTATDVAAKLKRFASRRPAEHLEKIIVRVLDLENVQDVRELTTII